jgi:hypothetical protein
MRRNSDGSSRRTPENRAEAGFDLALFLPIGFQIPHKLFSGFIQQIGVYSCNMKGNWLLWTRRAHLFLGVFFSPLLLMFIITGWWQTVTTDEVKEAQGGFFHTLMENFSNVHTDDYFPHPGASHHSHTAFKVLVVMMCLALIATICLGLVLAWQLKKKGTVVIVFVLGILVPALLLYFA